MAVLLQGSLVVGVSQTFRRWTEGTTCIRQDGHHILVVYDAAFCRLINKHTWLWFPTGLYAGLHLWWDVNHCHARYNLTDGFVRLLWWAEPIIINIRRPIAAELSDAWPPTWPSRITCIRSSRQCQTDNVSAVLAMPKRSRFAVLFLCLRAIILNVRATEGDTLDYYRPIIACILSVSFAT